MSKIRAGSLGTAILACGLAFGSPAQATLMLTAGPGGGNAGTDNVIFQACVGANAGPALTVQGCLNTSHTTLVNFTNTTENLVANGGQARIDPADGVAFDNVKITLNDPTLGFSKLIFNIDAIQDGSATFQAVDNHGTTFNFGSFAIGATGQNFFRLDSIDNQVAVSFKLVSTVPIQDISDLEQVRLGVTNAIPEPTTLGLIGLGLLGIGAMARRRRKSACVKCH